MSMDSVLKRCMTEIPGCVASGIVDMQTGMLLGVRTVDSHPQEILDILAAATKDLFEGDNVRTIEHLFKQARGVQSEARYFQQMIILSENLIHFFIRLPSDSTMVLVAVTRAVSGLGMLLAKGRRIANDINPSLIKPWRPLL